MVFPSIRKYYQKWRRFVVTYRVGIFTEKGLESYCDFLSMAAVCIYYFPSFSLILFHLFHLLFFGFSILFFLLFPYHYFSFSVIIHFFYYFQSSFNTSSCNSILLQLTIRSFYLYESGSKNLSNRSLRDSVNDIIFAVSDLFFHTNHYFLISNNCFFGHFFPRNIYFLLQNNCFLIQNNYFKMQIIFFGTKLLFFTTK